MLLLLAATLMLLAACGPAQAASNDEQVRAETARIAQQYQADQDASAARAALDGLGVANPRQWLMLQTEDLIASGADPRRLTGSTSPIRASGSCSRPRT